MITLITSLLLMLNSTCPAKPPVPIEEGRGCCSWHGGVCGCSSGQSVCCDGWLSSCGC